MIALSIAGFDNSGGAGTLADIRTFKHFGIYGVAVITALAVQNTQKVYEVFPIPPDVVKEELKAIFEDFPIKGVKIGMLANKEIAEVVYETLKSKKTNFIVLDPVFRSKSGRELLSEEGVEFLKSEFIKIVDLITPNVPEAEILCGEEIKSLEDVKNCAQKIYSLGAKSVLIKGGHLKGNYAIDILYDGKSFYEFKAPKIAGKTPRGTGCVYSSAILANYLRHKDLIKAIKTAKDFITEAIKNSKKLGKGYEIMDF
ncbi:bifunctional hydroxymethylpyrimidine kinase/phosphomethylpyrimidine kinase [Aquifex aeolicus]|uniref:Hydroxymethylpyrimidine/phosphomethylpyrimidine kinase n=1 Tax=Aquifex aeolicus (strain VF5) TaxID=224324 RepID=THID_AQUAE|nr:bifunctional hydroxymethylpyrimidine kinase/phosphomethylpyrimidine kinase [Aquifex aeolicus]O67772.1 RecName: Full=Hydroxymethylpyrimidine/phosphomethylpyrimidine kinase; AltName: Full=Hydroxymethylpyrimidine kinase; Short=HMP kinase; AltName: Full=Hydroxymethylpyrimidine phosphate kinase; Short=HMP-P kinase; Short=HMP-phosphate kinase; Short=HMPP kinase [Aquifex aeolicus VF5]AAC07733.1 HMP-P kinase [Aquifex aeolicus VF5]